MWVTCRARRRRRPGGGDPEDAGPPEARSLSRAFSSVGQGPAAQRRAHRRRDGRPAAAGGGRERRQPDGRGANPDLRDFFERFFDFGKGRALPAAWPWPRHRLGRPARHAGNILTNSHVVAKATKVTVTSPTAASCRPRWWAPTADRRGGGAAGEAAGGLVAARLGDSGKVEVGEWVLAVGSPLGMDQTVTAGIVSSKGKLGKNPTMNMSGEKVREYIQTDAKINPGNSGGPLVNLEGEVIGVNTMINTGPGGAYGFAIPINQARRVADASSRTGACATPSWA
jgi:hypothetical protein